MSVIGKCIENLPRANSQEFMNIIWAATKLNFIFETAIDQFYDKILSLDDTKAFADMFFANAIWYFILFISLSHIHTLSLSIVAHIFFFL
jgi:hypothetical protein